MSDVAANSQEGLLSQQERVAFAFRLLAAAGRIEAELYQRPVTFEQVCFSLECADALTFWARRLYRVRM